MDGHRQGKGVRTRDAKESNVIIYRTLIEPIPRLLLVWGHCRYLWSPGPSAPKEGPIPVGLITEREVYILLRKLVGIDAAGVEESRVIEQQ